MEKIQLNFFGENVEINTPEDLKSLKQVISEKYMFSPTDVEEIIIYYIKDSKKIYIINSNDYKTFLEEKIPSLSLDVSQNSKIYIDNLSKLQTESNDDQKKLDELLAKKKECEKEKEEKDKKYKDECTEINNQINELSRKKQLLVGVHYAETKKIDAKIKDYEKEIEELDKKLHPEKYEALRAKKPEEPKRVHNWCRSGQNNFPYSVMRIREEKRLKRLNEEKRKKELEEAEEKKRKELEAAKNMKEPVFKKVNGILGNAVEKIKEVAENTIVKTEEGNKDEEIKKIKEITKEAVKEINDLTKSVISQSNELIAKYEYERKLNLSVDDKLRGGRKKLDKDFEKEKEDAKNVLHYKVCCDICNQCPIKGIRYKCTSCKDYDLCQKCYDAKKEEHKHVFNPILKSQYPQYATRKNMKYMQRGICHRGVTCDICRMNPIRGYRYKCAVCDNFNFCEPCEEEKGSAHGHPLIKITRDYMEAKFNACYLKLNSFENQSLK